MISDSNQRKVTGPIERAIPKRAAMRDGAVPDGWRRVPFRALAEVNPGRRLAIGAPAPYVDMACVREQARGIAMMAERVFTGSGSRFQRGDTLFARITPCAENRKIAFVDRLSDGSVGFGSTEFIVLGPRPMFADPKFVYYLASWDPIVKLAVSRMTGTSGRQRVPEYVFREEIHVLAPPLPEQRKIAEILSSVDDAIERTEAVIEQARRVKQGLAQQLLTRGLPGRHADYKQTEVGEIPACWDVVRLDNVIEEMSSGFASGNRDEAGIAQLRMNNVTTDGRIVLDEVLKVPVPADVERWKLRAGDFLFNNTNSIDLVGKCAVFEDAPYPCTFSNHLTRLRFKPDLVPKWALLWFAVLWSRGVLKSLAIRHVGQAAIYGRELKRVKMPLPPLGEQLSMLRLVQAVDDRIERERHAVEQLRVAKSAIMHALLTGQVRASAAPH
jgi:type I restriction enzyme S subunit